MRRFLAAATLLLPVVAASGTVMAPFHVDFAAPAQAQGNLAMDRAEWALVLFHNSQHGDFNLSLAAGAKQTNFTMWKADVHSPQQGHFGAPVLEPDKVSTFPDAVAAQLDFYGSQWSSLVVQADSISAALAPSDANLQTTEDGQFIPSPPVHFPEDSLTEFNVKGALWHVPEGVAVSATPMNASGLRHRRLLQRLWRGRRRAPRIRRARLRYRRLGARAGGGLRRDGAQNDLGTRIALRRDAALAFARYDRAARAQRRRLRAHLCGDRRPR
jgi:hypothetical protein